MNDISYSVSVVIPMYNAEQTIVRTLESIVNQSYLPREIIIVDDGSSDSSYELVESFINLHPELNFKLINKKNGGVSSARNLGMKMSNSNWIALLDSDDEWLPSKLERQLQILKENTHIDFLGTNRNDEHFKSVLWKKLGHLTKISPKLLLIKFLFVVPTVIFKRSIVNDIGYFDENQKFAEEGNYFIRISQKYNCYLLNESLVLTGGGKAHFGHSGLSGNLKEMEMGELKNIKDALNLKIISILEYYFLSIFSILKYLRRIIIVKLRR